MNHLRILIAAFVLLAGARIVAPLYSLAQTAENSGGL